MLGSKVYMVAFENAVSKMAKEKAHEVMRVKTETGRWNGVPQKRQSEADTCTCSRTAAQNITRAGTISAFCPTAYGLSLIHI